MDAQAPYAYSPSSDSLDRQWVGYDDLKSVTVKVIITLSLAIQVMNYLFLLLRFYMRKH
jgi:hypothetical protein